MAISEYVIEAAQAVRLPGELQEILGTISYDPGDGEWYSDYHDLHESSVPVEIFTWALRLIGWLQSAYPHGPDFPEAYSG
jgi:hypothetical protein